MENLQTTILHKKKAANLESAKNNRIVHNAFSNLAQGYLIYIIADCANSYPLYIKNYCIICNTI